MQSAINNQSVNNAVAPNNTLGLTVIVPMINEKEQLPALVSRLDELAAEQLIFVDGGSTDGSVQWLQQNWESEHKQLILSSPGRAKQMNLGASYALHDMLLFLHADTQLPNGAKHAISSRTKGDAGQHFWGRFDVRFDSSSIAMNVIAFFMNWRSRLTGVATGDQAIFMHQHLFDRVGGFDDIALMEDVAMSKKLRKIIAPLTLKDKVMTSARRWQQSGVARTVVKMWYYRLAYFLGMSPERLAQGYRNIR